MNKLSFEQIREAVKEEYLCWLKDMDEEVSMNSELNESVTGAEEEFDACESIEDLIGLLDEMGFAAHRGEGYDFILSAIITKSEE